MLVTLFGIVMLVRLEQYSNADSPMHVTLFGITTFPEAAVPSIRIPLTITRGFFSCCALSHGVP